MGEATFTFRVDDGLKDEFTRAAKAHDRTGAQLLRDFMRDFVRQQHDAVEYDVWFRQKVQEGLEDTQPPVPHRQVMDEVQALIDRKRRAGA